MLSRAFLNEKLPFIGETACLKTINLEMGQITQSYLLRQATTAHLLEERTAARPTFGESH